MLLLRPISKRVTPTAGVLTDLFVVQDETYVVISTIFACNNSSVLPSQVRITHAPAGAADAVSHNLYAAELLPPARTFAATTGFTVAGGDIIRVRYDLLGVGVGSVTFTLYGLVYGIVP